MEDRTLASDAERDQTVEQLSSAHLQGRLTQHELQSRIAEVREARTRSQLLRLTSDLPPYADTAAGRTEQDSASSAGAATHYEPPREKNPVAIVEALHPRGMTAAWSAWAIANAAIFMLWLLAAVAGDQSTYPWFLWIAGPWGFALLVHTIHSRGSRHDRGTVAKAGTTCHVPPSESSVDPRRYQSF
jgi:hypothetical protein